MASLLDLLLPHRCPVCRRPGVAPCARCIGAFTPPPDLPPPPGIDACHAVVAYHDAGRALVATLKFTAARGVLPWVATALAGQVERAGLDVVTWLPSAPVHRRRRGRDQAEAIARAVAVELGLPTASLLRRGPGPPQTGRSAAERLAGPPISVARLPPPGVLVVDDVVTTGGSMAAAARVLRAAGAHRVVALAVARTPPTGGGATRHGS